MNIITGLAIVFGCISGGFPASGGHIELLRQPCEFIVILGAGVGASIAGYPIRAVQNAGKALAGGLRSQGARGARLSRNLRVPYGLTRDLRPRSRNAIESHIDNPTESPMFQTAPSVLKNGELTAFI